MRSLLIIFSILIKINSLKIDEYISSLEELTRDEQFLEDYTRWSLKLFSSEDYIYGKQLKDFPCKIPSVERLNDPITVHSLRPIDVQCVGALGDSLTAGLGAHALTPIGLFTEYRGKKI
jgi:hypothetical protein